MSHRNGRNSDTEWKGPQQFDNLPSLTALSFRVGEEQIRSCSGSLALFDEAIRRSRQFTWQAKYMGEGRWDITGKEAGGVFKEGFSLNKSVNHEMTVFVRDRLNDMKRKGVIFQPRPKPAASDEPLQPNS